MALAVPTRSPSRASTRSSSSSVSFKTAANDNVDIIIEGQLVKPRSFRRTASGLVDCHRVLTHTFGYDAYKGRQKEIVEAAVRGADVLVVAPTGMGKSLCFQIPAIADQYGVSIVVSPLLALMSNQVQTLKEKGVDVAKLCSDTPQHEKSWIAKDLASGHPRIRLLYITPEKLASAEFSKLMIKVYENRQVMRLVVDEAHCISEWGWDFRPEYRLLGNFRQKYPEVPIMALTASATKSVQDDIVASLKMSPEHLLRVVHPFNRKNLHYEVRYVANPEPHLIMQDIVDFILKRTQKRGRASSGIIYCRTRATCDSVSGFLRRKGISAKPYHRGVSNKILEKTLQEWLEDTVEVVVATVAFGMGIDKGDVRYVIHYDLPKSFEGYYQETGRAGRDGGTSRCILYYSREDAFKVQQQVQQDFMKRLKGAPKTAAPSQRAPRSMEMLMNMVEDITTCRHVSICRYFGEVIDCNDPDILRSYCDRNCDVCKEPAKVKQRKSELASEEHIASQSSVLQAIMRENEPLDEDDDPVVPVKKEPVEKSRIEWSTRLLDDVDESDESDGDNAIKEIVPYQAKLPVFPKVYKPPAAAGSASRPLSGQFIARSAGPLAGSNSATATNRAVAASVIPPRPSIVSPAKPTRSFETVIHPPAARRPAAPIGPAVRPLSVAPRPSQVTRSRPVTASDRATPKAAHGSQIRGFKPASPVTARHQAPPLPDAATSMPTSDDLIPVPSNAGPPVGIHPQPGTSGTGEKTSLLRSSSSTSDGSKRLFAEVDPNAEEVASKRPRNNLSEIARNGPVRPMSSGALSRQTSKPAFKTPFMKPPSRENLLIVQRVASASSDTIDLTGDHNTEPAPNASHVHSNRPLPDNGKGTYTTVTKPGMDMDKGHVRNNPARSGFDVGKIAKLAHEKPWNAPSDLLVFQETVEVPHSPKLPHQARDAAATAILRLLGSVMLQFSGRDELWGKVGLLKADRSERRDILQLCAKEVEFEMFTLAATLQGYQESLKPREAGIRMMRDASSAAWTEGPERHPETVEARCVVSTLRRICAAPRKSKQVSEFS